MQRTAFHAVIVGFVAHWLSDSCQRAVNKTIFGSLAVFVDQSNFHLASLFASSSGMNARRVGP